MLAVVFECVLSEVSPTEAARLFVLREGLIDFVQRPGEGRQPGALAEDERREAFERHALQHALRVALPLEVLRGWQRPEIISQRTSRIIVSLLCLRMLRRSDQKRLPG